MHTPKIPSEGDRFSLWENLDSEAFEPYRRGWLHKLAGALCFCAPKLNDPDPEVVEIAEIYIAEALAQALSPAGASPDLLPLLRHRVSELLDGFGIDRSLIWQAMERLNCPRDLNQLLLWVGEEFFSPQQQNNAPPPTSSPSPSTASATTPAC